MPFCKNSKKCYALIAYSERNLNLHSNSKLLVSMKVPKIEHVLKVHVT